MAEKVGEVLQKINNLTDGDFTHFLLKHNICPECLGFIVESDSESVCSSCGRVVETASFSRVIPFGQERTTENNLAFGNGRGGSIQEKGLFCLLAKASKNVFKCPKCGVEINDLPLRAQQIKILAQRFEHPKILSLLKFGRILTLNWFGTKKSPKSILFSNFYGRVLRKVGAYYIIANVKTSLKMLATACFVLCLRDVVGESAYELAKEKFGVDESMLKEASVLYEVVKS